MIVSRRKRADRLSSVVLLCLVVGLCGTAWFALRRPAPVEPSRAPAASPQPATTPSSVAPAADDLAVLWPNASAAAGSPQLASPMAGFAPSGDEAPPFTIRGLFAFLSGSSSVAFVQSPGGELIIHQGEVADGWKLVAVTMNTATFARDSRQVTLSLAKREYGAGSGAAPVNAASGRTQAAPSMRVGPVVSVAQQPPAPQAENSASVAAGSVSVSPAAAKAADKTVAVPRTLADMVRTNPGAALKGLQIEPYMSSNGQLQGFTVASVAEGAVAAPYVSQGDRILAVNGTPINSMSSAVSIYQQLAAGGSTSVTLTLERGGQRQDVVYSIK